MTDTNDLRAYGLRQKVGRLKREIKEHKQNCYKRQHKMLQLQEVMFKDSNTTSRLVGENNA